MQRRTKVDQSVNENAVGHESSMGSSTYSKKPARSTLGSRSSSRWKPGALLNIFLLAVVLFAMGTFIFPNELRQVEDTTAKTTKDLVNNAYRVEQKMEDWLIQQHMPQEHVNVQDLGDAPIPLELQQSSWVDGEKKLKQQLKVLADKQARGEELGVPVLTRYLGEDFPAWAGKDDNKAEWEERVKAKYAEMARAEERWKENVKAEMERRRAQVKVETDGGKAETTTI